MEKKRTKKEIVRMLLNQNLETDNEDELIEMLINDPIAVDIDKATDENKKFGDIVADKITAKAGSWGFIIGFIVFLLVWIFINIKLIKNLDPYPFILLNLVLSCIAALQAPIIMMSQNRSAKKDSLRGHNDYKTDLKSELILEELHHQVTNILANQKKILRLIETDEENIDNKK